MGIFDWIGCRPLKSPYSLIFVKRINLFFLSYGCTREVADTKKRKGGNPRSRNFYVCTHVNFTRLNKIETMYERSRVNVKVEPRSTFTFTCGLSYIASISFRHVNFACVRRENYSAVEIKPKSRVCDLRSLSISIDNSMICRDIWHKYHE